MYDLVIKNGTVVDETGLVKADLWILNGRIAGVAKNREGFNSEGARQEIDAAGKLIFPGIVDAHMHIGEYRADFEDMQTATMAAAAGGVTTCIDMPLNLYSPSVLNADVFRRKKKLLEQESYVDFRLWGALVPRNLNELEELANAGAAAFKCFMSGGGNDFEPPTLGELRQALRTLRRLDRVGGFHCEDPSITATEKRRVIDLKLDGRQAFLDSRPLVSELIATDNILKLAAETGASIHICHVSHPETACRIAAAKLDGVDVTAETCPHYLTYTAADYLEKGCLLGCAPPLREEQAREGLWHYLKNGTLDFIASDHSPGMPRDRDDTRQPTYCSGFGISGVQTMLQTVYDQAVNRRGISPGLLAKALSAEPARRFGLYGRKGALQVGFDADLVIFDPEKPWQVKADELFYKQKVTAYEGLSGKGCPETVLIRGRCVFADGRIQVDKGFGKYLEAGHE